MPIPSASPPPPLLNPPPRPNRARASSTNLRPPLSLTTLSSRTTAGAFAGTQEHEPHAESASSESTCWSEQSSRASPKHDYDGFDLPPIPVERLQPTSALGSNMFPLLVSRTVELLRALRPGASNKEKASLFDTPMASPRSSTDTEYILPLSASPCKTAFDDVDLTPPPHIRAYFHLPPFPSVHAPLLLVIILFPLSAGLVLLCLSTLPITFAWPRTLTDLAQLGRELNTYSQSGLGPTAHVFAVLSVSAVWKHAWSIPGSVLWNVLAGALFHPLLATLVMTLLTSLGSIFSTLLAMPLAPTLSRAFPRPIEITRQALEGSSSPSSSSVGPNSSQSSNATASSSSGGTPAWVRLSVLRLVGVVPWSALNVACGITGVSLRNCFLGAFIGTLPWTAVTCQIGDILHTVGVVSSNSTMEGDLGDGLSKSATLSSVLASPQIVLELIFLSVLSLAPILGRKQLSRLISSSGETSVETAADEEEDAEEKQGSSPAGEPAKDLESEKYCRIGRGRKVHHQQWTWKRISMSVPRFNTFREQRETLLDEHLDR